MSGSKCLGLDQTSLLSMGGGDRLVRGLTSSNSVVEAGVAHQDGAGGGGAGHGQEGEADKGLEGNNLTETSLSLPHFGRRDERAGKTRSQTMFNLISQS